MFVDVLNDLWSSEMHLMISDRTGRLRRVGPAKDKLRKSPLLSHISIAIQANQAKLLNLKNIEYFYFSVEDSKVCKCSSPLNIEQNLPFSLINSDSEPFSITRPPSIKKIRSADFKVEKR